MNLTGLRYFLALAETASFTKAAGRLNVTQPTLSTAIARLEEQLGARLFERDRKRVALTASGQRLLPRAQAILAEWRQAQADMTVARPRRRLRVGLLATLPQAAAIGFVDRLRQADPALELELHEGAPGALHTRLQQSQLDIALNRLDGLPEDLPYQPLHREAYRLAVGAGNLLAVRERCSVRDLAETPFLLRARCEVTDQARGIFARHGVRPRVLLRSPSEDRIAALVVADHGACFLPESLAQPGMALLAIDELPLTRRLGFVARRDLAAELAETGLEAAQAIRWQARPRGGLGFAH
ncbi:MAG: LysR family transcriptional regulator [Reyranellaceae bacterium]